MTVNIDGDDQPTCDDAVDTFFEQMERNEQYDERDYFKQNFRNASFINFFPPAAKIDEASEFKILTVPTPKGSQNIGRRIVDRAIGEEVNFIHHQSSSWVYLAPVQAVLISSISSCSVSHTLRDIGRRVHTLWSSNTSFKEIIRLPRSEIVQMEEWNFQRSGDEESSKFGNNGYIVNLDKKWKETKKSFISSPMTSIKFPFNWNKFCLMVDKLKYSLRFKDISRCFVTVSENRLDVSIAAVIAVTTSGGCISSGNKMREQYKDDFSLILSNYESIGSFNTNTPLFCVDSIDGMKSKSFIKMRENIRANYSDISVISLYQNSQKKRFWRSSDIYQALMRLHSNMVDINTNALDDDFCTKCIGVILNIPVNFVSNLETVNQLALPITAMNQKKVFYGFGNGIYTRIAKEEVEEKENRSVFYDTDSNDGYRHFDISKHRILLTDDGKVDLDPERNHIGCIKRKPTAREKDLPPMNLMPVDDEEVSAIIEKVLTRMFELLPLDETLKKVAIGLDFSLMFTLPDVDLSFHLTFKDDKLSAYFVDEKATANVKFRMSSTTLDGIFTQKVNVIGATFAGQIVFEGDVEKAVLLQGFMADFARLYIQAFVEAGGTISMGNESPPSFLDKISPYLIGFVSGIFSLKKYPKTVLMMIMLMIAIIIYFIYLRK